MKYILSILTILTILLFARSASALTPEKNNLYVAPYLNNSDLNTLFETTQVLDYLEGDYIEQPIALFTATPSQTESIKAKGIRPELIEEYVNVTQFIYLYHPQPEQAYKLAEYGDVYAITSHHTLVKLDNPSTFEFTGEIVEFSRMPLGQIVEKPQNLQVVVPSVAPIENERSMFDTVLRYWYILPVLFAVGGGIIGYLLYKRRKENQHNI